MPGDPTTRRHGIAVYVDAAVDDDPPRPKLECAELLAAMLERSILDYLGADPVEADDAERWLFGEPVEPAVGISLEHVAAGLGFHADDLRRRLRGLRGRRHRTGRVSLAGRLADAA